MYRFRAIAAATFRVGRARQFDAVFFNHGSAYKMPVCISRAGLCTNAEKPPIGEGSNKDFAATKKSQLGGDVDVNKAGANQSKISDIAIVTEAVANFLHSVKNLSPEDASSLAANAGGFASHILASFRKSRKDPLLKPIKKHLDVYLRTMKINEFLIYFESVGLDLDTATRLSHEQMNMPSLLRITSFLVAYGVERRSVGNILERNRMLLNCPLEDVAASITYLEEDLGIHKEDILTMIAQSPELLKPDLQQRWKPFFDLLQFHNVQFPAVKKLVKHFSGHMARLPGVYFMRGIQFFHKELNMQNADVARILKSHPEVLLLDFDKTLACKVEFLRKYGVKGEDMTRIFCRCPSIVGYSIDTLTQKIDYLLSVGIWDKGVKEVLVAYPAILATSVENKMKPAVACLEAAGITGLHLGKLLTKRPAIFAIDVKVRLPMILENLKDLGPKGMVLVLCWGLAEGIVAMEARLGFLKNLGFRNEELVRMLSVDPRILKISKQGLEMKVRYLTREMGMDKDILLKNPTFLYSHLQKRIQIRHQVLLMLHQKGVLPKPPELTQIMFPSNLHFMERYVNPYPECVALVTHHMQGILKDEAKQKALMLRYTPQEKQKREAEKMQRAENALGLPSGDAGAAQSFNRVPRKRHRPGPLMLGTRH